MLIDHTGAVFPLIMPISMRWIGRVAFPVFAYMIAQGCKHTSSIKKYMLRLGIFALISEIPFDLAFRNSLGIAGFLTNTNVFYTLFFGVACIAIYEKLENCNKIVKISAVLPLLIIAEALGMDYGAFGVGFIFILYIAQPENKYTRTAVLASGIVYLYGLSFLLQGWMEDSVSPGYFLFALAAVPLVFFYNGKKGPKIKWIFYAFYPIHLMVLAAIRLVFEIE